MSWRSSTRSTLRRAAEAPAAPGVSVSRPSAVGTRSLGPRTGPFATTKGDLMGYGIGGVLILILVILAIIYFAKRV